MNYFIFKVLKKKLMSFVHVPYYSRQSILTNSRRGLSNMPINVSKPTTNSSIKKDPKVTEKQTLTSLKSNPPNIYNDYNNYNYNKYSIGQSTNSNDYARKQSQKNHNPNFRIRDSQKSSQSMLKSLRQQQQKKSIYDYSNKMTYSTNQKQPLDDYLKKTQEFTVRVQKDVFKNKTIGLVGLNNIGNTCFMNSTLQCVLNLPGFNDYFLEDKHLKEATNGSRVAMAYGRLIKLMRSSTSKSQTPSQLKSAVAAKKPRFQGYAQQDAQQFLTGLLQLLSLDLNRSSKPKYRQLTADTSKHSLLQISQEWWKYNKQRQDSIVCDYFTGQLLSKVVCSKCKNQSIAFDNTWDFALNFGKDDRGDVLKMIQNFLTQEVISSDYYCNKCKTFRQCKRKLDFFRLPKLLVFEIKRFSYGKYSKKKLNNSVKVKDTLDLSSVITHQYHSSVKNPVYELVGIVNHSGDIDFGHYTAQCRNPINKKWYTFNDSSVYQSRARQSFQSSSPYLLFYAKKQIV